jgi:hypothetical protein
MHGRDEKCIHNFVQKTWRRPLGRPRNRWEDNIRMDLVEIEWKSVYWMHLGHDKESSDGL